jgi:N-dimethylarginine dimethylaminohydrolase
MLSINQPWDKLKTCVVGRSYPPEFYSFMTNTRLRNLFEKIAEETEEDFQKLIAVLEKFDVNVIRPNNIQFDPTQYQSRERRIPGPIHMVPRDQMCMIGEKFLLFPFNKIAVKTAGRIWDSDYYFEDAQGIETKQEYIDLVAGIDWWKPITDFVTANGNKIISSEYESILSHINANGMWQIGQDLYFGQGQFNEHRGFDFQLMEHLKENHFSDYRVHTITSGGHIDGCFSPVVPGLILSIWDMDSYAETFPGWEVCYLEGEGKHKMQGFTELKEKNAGSWWIQNAHNDDELIDYVETWFKDWVGYSEESVFDVNVLNIDEKNVIVNGYNKTVFDTFERYGITAHICPIRHRYFWDGGIHCVTLDLDRLGSKKDWFPDRG